MAVNLWQVGTHSAIDNVKGGFFADHKNRSDSNFLALLAIFKDLFFAIDKVKGGYFADHKIRSDSKLLALSSNFCP